MNEVGRVVEEEGFVAVLLDEAQSHVLRFIKGAPIFIELVAVIFCSGSKAGEAIGFHRRPGTKEGVFLLLFGIPEVFVVVVLVTAIFLAEAKVETLIKRERIAGMLSSGVPFGDVSGKVTGLAENIGDGGLTVG